MNGILRRSFAALAAIALVITLAACGDDDDGGNASDDSGGGDVKAGKIAILLPETKTTRYEAFDRPYMEDKIEELCPDCEVLYSNADQDAAKQQSQADAALTNGAEVMILDPVDSEAAVSIVNKAKQEQVPVISYDRLITGAPIDYYISFDNEEVGKLQGEALIKALEAGGDPKRGEIVMINGSPTDNNAGQFKKGAEEALKGNVNIGQSYDTPDWSPDEAQREMDQAITALGKDKIIGVYAANDGTAGGAIAAMKGAQFAPIPPTTGQDAELAAIQRILTGDQYMTVYKAIKPEADKAAEVAVALLQGDDVEGDTTVDNESGDIPATLLTPVEVVKENIKDTVIKDGFYTVEQLCTGSYATACQEAGIT